MNEIDFLPRSYRIAQARRRRAQAVSTAAAVVAAGMLIWGAWADRQLDGLAEYAHLLREQANVVRAQDKQLEHLRGERAALNRQLWVYRRIVQPVSPSQVIAALADMMPESASLTRLSVSVEALTVQQRGGARRGRHRGPGGSPSAERGPTEAEQKQSRVRVVLTGLAPSDVLVAEFVGRMSSYPLFEDVKMRSSRTVQIGNLLAREFRIEAEVPLDREYLPTTLTPEVAHAE